MIRIRRAAIGFALLSTLYWLGVTGLWQLITLLNYPYWLVAITGTLPPMIYAVCTLWFCGRLARSVLRQTMTLQQSGTPE